MWRCACRAWPVHPWPSADRPPPCVSARSDPDAHTRVHSIRRKPLVSLAGIFLHGFGQRYDLPAPLALYLFAAGGVVVVSFVLVVMFAGGRVGAKAIAYPRLAVPLLTRIARTPWPRFVGGLIGVIGLAPVIITGLFGSTDNDRNPAEYLTWIYFWAATVILSGLVGNVWYLLNPWAAIYDALRRLGLPSPPLRGGAPHRVGSLGIWPAVLAYLAFACVELTTGLANRPWQVAT